MMTFLHIVADFLLGVLVFIYDRRIAELEEKMEELETKIIRIGRKLGRPYG